MRGSENDYYLFTFSLSKSKYIRRVFSGSSFAAFRLQRYEEKMKDKRKSRKSFDFCLYCINDSVLFLLPCHQPVGLDVALPPAISHLQIREFP